MNCSLLKTIYVVLALAPLAVSGCGQGPNRIQAPGMNASRAGQLAMDQYDQDGDGAVAGAELDAAPTLKAALATLDTNSDGSVSADEVQQRVESWSSAGTGLTTVGCRVDLNGRPLGGAEVVFEPEGFLGDGLPTAIGTTNRFGMASPSVPKEKRPTPDSPPGLPLGLYKVRISKMVSGKEMIPSRYNTETTLGQQVSYDDPAIAGNNVVFSLDTK